jgi:hypothetical protein
VTVRIVLGLEPAVITALIAAFASLAVALIGIFIGERYKRRSNEEIETLKASLVEAQAERNAQRDYRYDAIKSLYRDLQPLMFQLSELCESAYMHTRGLARAARNGNLGRGEGSWWRDEYFLLSTVHRLLVPVAVLHLVQRRLTSVDLSVDEKLRAQYRFARALAGTWNSGFDFASAAPELEYKPHDGDAAARAASEPAVYGLQHLYAGEIDQIVSALVVSEQGGAARYRGYGEFHDAYRAADAAVQDRFAPAVHLFAEFHPRTHPVLWRMLVTQAHLHQAISRTFVAGEGVIVLPTEVFDEAERDRFDWREPGATETEEQAVGAPFAAARAYLERLLAARPA